MYCEHCGTASKPEAKYCYNCGHQLQAQAIASALTPIVESPEIERHHLAVEPASIQRIESLGERQEPRLDLEMPQIERPQLAVESAPFQPVEPLGDRQEPSEEVARKPEIFLGAHHPWRRFFARAVDMALATPLLYLFFFSPIGQAFSVAEFLLGTDNAVALVNSPYVVGVLIFLLWVPIEAGLLSSYGATFGKWAFGLRVLESDGSRLLYGKAFGRAFFVLTYGVGFGIPIVTSLTALYSYYRLEKYGTTDWDSDNATWSVSCQPWTLIGGLICAFAVFLALMSGALTPPVVAKLQTGYWAGRAGLPPLTSSPKAVQPVRRDLSKLNVSIFDDFHVEHSQNAPLVAGNESVARKNPKKKSVRPGNRTDAPTQPILPNVVELDAAKSAEKEANEIRKLTAAYPDWLSIIQTTDFKYWRDNVITDGKELMESEDAEFIGRNLMQFKEWQRKRGSS